MLADLYQLVVNFTGREGFHLITMIATIILSGMSKYKWLQDSKMGSWYGIITGIVAAIYFYYIDSEIFITLELGFIALCALDVAKIKSDLAIPIMRGLMYTVFVILLISTFRGPMTVIQFFASVLFLKGVFDYLNEESRARGWLILTISHILAAIATMVDPVFASAQIIFSLMSIYGYHITKKKVLHQFWCSTFHFLRRS